MEYAGVELKAVSKFYVVQADRSDGSVDTIIEEKVFTDYKEAFRVVQESEAPVRYLTFIYGSEEYKMTPIEDSEEYDVVKKPIYN